MQSLSLVIITYNEEANLADCIQSAAGICEEILVLDSFSTDGTRGIAENLGARVETHAFDGHIQQKNRAKNMAKNDWVLSLDADERLSTELLQSIRKVLENPNFEGYSMNRLNHYKGKAIKHCGWYPDRKLRLWRRDKGDWTGVNPHDRFELHSGESALISGDILHFTYASKEAMVTQVHKFANIAAAQNTSHSIAYLAFKMFFSSTFKFVKTYVFQLGLLDGIDGLQICRYQALEVWMKYAKAIGLKRKL
jgi:glycosyltransferase involved in cell wall biosynthesis